MPHLGCRPFSWAGFQHEESGMDAEECLTQYRRYVADLDEALDYGAQRRAQM